jgi:hypothetical protein
VILNYNEKVLLFFERIDIKLIGGFIMTKDSQPDNKKARMEKCNYQTPITFLFLVFCGKLSTLISNLYSSINCLHASS